MLILVRHGRTEANASGRLLGRTDPPLDPLGEQQAARLGRVLADRPVELLVSSPLLRTRQTALGLGLGLEVTVDERWVELDYGELDGRRLSEVPAETWHRWRTDPTFAPPGGESMGALAERVEQACEAWLARSVDRDVVVVSHVGPIKAAVGWALGLGGSAGWRLHLDPASISRIAAGPRGPVLHAFNETDHLHGLVV